MNNYLTRENALWALGIIAALLVLGLLGWWAASQNESQPARNLVETVDDAENATTSNDTTPDTDEEGQESEGQNSSSETRTAGAGSTNANTATAQQGATNTQESGSTAAPSDNDDVEVAVELEQTGPAELGPRVAADSPTKALELLVEAMGAGDVDRAVSYFAPHVQEQYRTSFTSQDAPLAQHVVVRAYHAGTVEDVELVDPDHGIYEIAVYPQGSSLPLRLRFAYNAEVGEYVIFEL